MQLYLGLYISYKSKVASNPHWNRLDGRNLLYQPVQLRRLPPPFRNVLALLPSLLPYITQRGHGFSRIYTHLSRNHESDFSKARRNELGTFGIPSSARVPVIPIQGLPGMVGQGISVAGKRFAIYPFQRNNDFIFNRTGCSNLFYYKILSV